jgi:signal transduction histidine kinase/DNA-binding response OmpR family regulator/streptogramin lyase
VDDLLIIGLSGNELCLFDPVKRRFYTKEKFEVYSELFDIKPPIYAFAKDHNNLFWIGTADGLFTYDLESQKIIYKSTETLGLNEPKYNKLDQARTVFIDNNGIVWAGIGKTGLNKYDPSKNKFSKWFISINSDEKYRDYISDLQFYNNKQLWIGTAEDGLIKMNVDDSQIQRFFADDNVRYGIKSLHFDVNGHLWIGTADHGILEFDPVDEVILRHIQNDPNNSNSLSHNKIIKLLPADNGLIWVITQENLQLLDPITGEFDKNQLLSEIPLENISGTFKDNDGDYWIAVFSKLCFIDHKTNEIVVFSGNSKNQPYIPSSQVNDICHTKNNMVWFASKSGLFKYNKAQRKFEGIDPSNPLIGNYISNIEADRHGNLWVLTLNDLIKFNIESNQFTNYSYDDGLTPMCHNLSKANDDKLIILDEKGFYWFSPDSIRKNETIPPVYITAININGVDIHPGSSEILEKSPIQTEKITIRHEHKVLKIKFNVLNFNSPEKNVYAYQLEGYDTSWNYLGNNNEITLMNLEPGNYVLNVAGSNNDNVWNMQGDELSITVRPPWYKSLLAYIVYFIIIFTVFLFNRMYARNRERLKRKFEIEKLKAEKKYELERIESRKEHELDQLKLKFFFDISHEFRTPLTLILGPLSRLLKQENSPIFRETYEMMFRNASRLKDLINQLLDIRKLENGQMPLSLSLDSLNPFLKHTVESFSELSLRNEVRLIKNIDIPSQSYYYDKDKIQKIISNILANAIKFTLPNKKVDFTAKVLAGAELKVYRQKIAMQMEHVTKTSFEEDEITDALVISVSDQGIGIEPHDLTKIFTRFYQINNKQIKPPGTGIGLSLTKELLELLNGELFIQSIKNAGTQIISIIPLSSEIYTDEEIIDEQKAFPESNPGMAYTDSDISETNTAGEVELPETENTKKPTVLVVEDNVDLQKFMYDILSQKYIVKKGFNGQEGLEKTIKYIPDLIVTDIMMPVIDGFEFCRRLKEIPKFSHIPIIVLTAKDQEDSIKTFLDSGVDDYIIKPFHADLFISRIDNLIQTRIMLKNAYKTKKEILPEGINLVNRDEEFVQKAMDLVEKNLTNSDFNKDAFARNMGVSRSQLYKRLIALTNESPNEFVRNIKLRKAAQILQKGTTLQISEIGYMVGFSDPNYFTRKFREYFGKTPSEYGLENYQKEVGSNDS